MEVRGLQLVDLVGQQVGLPRLLLLVHAAGRQFFAGAAHLRIGFAVLRGEVCRQAHAV